MDKKTLDVLNLLKSKAVFETSENGNKGHVIWSSQFYKLAQELAELLDKPYSFLITHPPSLKQKDMKGKAEIARFLKSQKYSIREIMKILGYKSPRSVQVLLEK
jgi:hypothetical protein